jgi:hypothetical protein
MEGGIQNWLRRQGVCGTARWNLLSCDMRGIFFPTQQFFNVGLGLLIRLPSPVSTGSKSQISAGAPTLASNVAPVKFRRAPYLTSLRTSVNTWLENL